MRWVSVIIASVFGAGYSPIAPGTVGALVGCIILWLGEKTLMLATYPSPWFFLGLIIAVTLLGIWATNQLEKYWGKDPSKVVVDELVGVWIAMIMVPFSWVNLLLAFGLFRFFDIAKPLGIRQMEKMSRGVGVMADDILAGIYSNIVLQIIIFIISIY